MELISRINLIKAMVSLVDYIEYGIGIYTEDILTRDDFKTVKDYLIQEGYINVE